MTSVSFHKNLDLCFAHNKLKMILIVSVLYMQILVKLAKLERSPLY